MMMMMMMMMTITITRITTTPPTGEKEDGARRIKERNGNFSEEFLLQKKEVLGP